MGVMSIEANIALTYLCITKLVKLICTLINFYKSKVTEIKFSHFNTTSCYAW